MGLFKKRSTDPEEMDRLRAEIASMGERLAASDQAKDELHRQVDGLTTRLDKPIAPPPTEPPPPSIDPAQLDLLNAKIERLAAATRAPVDASRIDELTSSIDQLSSRVDQVEQSPAEAAGPEADEARVDAAQVDELQAAVQRITDRLDELDGRITSISTELANQLTELSGEIDGLGPGEPATDEGVDGLRDAQTRLANEQARYQIAFRQDLADLAARLKRA